MKNKYLKFLFPVALILALTASMIGTRSVLADDAPPTPTDEVSTETPPVEDPSETQETVEQTVPEILEQLPAETEIVVLDENNEPLPLVSNEAATVLVTGDPQWCPAGVTPGTDTLGQCTAAHTSFNNLITDLQTNSATYYGSGTIYVAYDYNAVTAGDSSNDIVFDYGMVGLTDLTVQGGWDFAQDKVVGTSTIELGTGYSLEFWDWGYGAPGNLTLKDLILINSDDLFIGNVNGSTAADVTFENIEVDDTEYGAYIETEGNVEITDSQFTNTKNDNGLTIYSYGDVTLENVKVDNNEYGGAYIDTEGNVVVTNSQFTDTKNGSGLIVYSGGDITLTGVYAASNYGDGVFLDNSCGCTLGNIFVSSSVMSFNGITTEGRGLVAHSNGNITIRDVDISFNGGGGAELINCFFDFFGSNTCLNTNPAKITVTGTNTFQGNGYNPPQFLGSGPYASVGLWIGSNSDVSVAGVNATGNGAGNMGGGALIFTENGTMAISNSSFSDSCTTFQCDLSFGLIAINLLGSGTTLNNVVASGNGNGDGSSYSSSLGFGALVVSGTGNAFVSNSTFNNNCTAGTCTSGAGIITMANGSITFNTVTASNNGPSTGGSDIGATIQAGGNVDIYCSTFSNEEVGLQVDTVGVVSLNGVTFSGNTTDFIPPSSGTWVSNPFNCVPAPSKGSGSQTINLPLRVVNVGSGNGTDLDCENYSGTKFVLENGDNLVVPCPLGGSASLNKQEAGGLPSALPNGSTFRSGIVSVVTDSGSVDGKLSQPVLVSFIMPEGVDASALAILYWDGSQWVEVNGTFVLTENGKTYFAAFVNYTGTFVLVQR